MTSIKKEIMEEWEQNINDLGCCGGDSLNCDGYKKHEARMSNFLSQALTRIEEAAKAELREKMMRYTCDFNWDFEKGKAKNKSYVALDDVLKLFSPSEEKEVVNKDLKVVNKVVKEFGYMGKVTNAGNIASSEKDSVCNCDGTVHRKSSHSPKKEKRGR